MEVMKYVIQKFSDTYLLPAVTSTFIALIYFSYKWGRTNSKDKPRTIFHIFYFGNDIKHEDKNCNVLTEPNFPVTILQPTIAPQTALTEFRNTSLPNKMLPIKWKAKLQSGIAKLHGSLIKNDKVYAYPIYKVWDKTEHAKDSANLVKESEPIWDYFDVINPSYDQSFKHNSLFYKSLEGDNNSNHCNINTVLTRNALNTEIWNNNANENLVKNENAFEMFTKTKEGRVPSTNYYRFCYDTESKNYDSVSFGTTLNEANTGSERIPKELTNQDKKQSSYEDTLDASEFVFVELNSQNCSEESFKTECTLVDFEKDILNRMQSENYWDIA